MSLEKEPAGAFNKAQRLIEQVEYILLSRVCKERSQFVLLQPTSSVPANLRRACSLTIGIRWRLTVLRGGAHVRATRLLAFTDKWLGRAATNIAARSLPKSERSACAIGCLQDVSHSQPGSINLHVLVRDNNVEQALRVLKKKMQREGVFREMKQRRSYEKPSERKTREKSEAVRRARKLARKQAIREGLLPAPPKKKPFERKPPLPEIKARAE